MQRIVQALLAWALLSALPAWAGALADLNVINRATGQRLPVYVHNGRLYVAGQPGERYSVQVVNRSGGRILSVVSVDGVNVVSGETAAPDQTGYVFSPGQSYDIAGWRKNADEVAAFYFTALPDTYAARTDRPGNVGVIGVAVFREWTPPRPRRDFYSRSQEESGMAPNGSLKAERADSAPAASAPAERSLDDALAARPAPLQRREKLGTGHGEREYAAVSFTDFRRASSRPTEVLSLYYDRYENLVAAGIIPSATQYAQPRPFPGAVRFVPDPR